MSDYIRVYNLTVKDSLPTGNSGKVIKGTELDTELNAVAAAISSKADTNSPTFTGTPVAPTATFGTNTTQLATTAFVQAALQAIYPVGSVYINASVSTNPSTLLGFGTWITVGDGKVLVNQDTTDTSFDVLGETGGSKDAIVVSHTHTFSGTTGYMSANAYHSHSVYDPGHAHIYRKNENNGSAQGGCCSNGDYFYDAWTDTRGTNIGIYSADTDHTHAYSGTTTSSGNSATNANLQPYITVKMWKRTA